MKPEIVSVADPQELARVAAERFVALAQSAIETQGRFAVALSGGSTPRALYERLTQQPIDWSHVHVFWGDERCVPPDHPDSNYGLANRALLSHVKISASHVHRWQGELPPAQSAQNYDTELRGFFGALPRFDLILLGLGADAHTASLFPGTAAIHEQQRWVIAHYVEKLQADRLTLTPPVLNQAAQVMFLVTGSDKTAALRSVWHEPYNPDRFPAQIVRPMTGSVIWLVDRAAAP